MLEPPSLIGATQDRAAVPSPATALTPVGAPGTVRGVVTAVAVEGTLLPMEFLAVTVNV